MPRNRTTAQAIADKILTGHNTTLVRKPINLPTIPCGNNEPEPDWHHDLFSRARDGDSAHEWATLYQSLQAHRIEYWEETARAFEADPGDFYKAWHYLDSHPMFWRFHNDGAAPATRIHERYLMHDRRLTDSVTIDVVKINPANHRRNDDPDLNTLTEVWIEMGKWGWPGTDTGDPQNRDAHWHDPDLDCAADTIEHAIITAAVMVHTAYGNDRSACDDPDPLTQARQATAEFIAHVEAEHGPVTEDEEAEAAAVLNEITKECE